jgi:hypothetical protein
MPNLTVGTESSGNIDLHNKDWGQGAARSLQPWLAPERRCP